MLIDTHCHLQSCNYNNNDEVINRASKEGVKILIISGYDYNSNEEAIELANIYSNVYATIGYGPSVADLINEESFNVLEKQLTNNKVIGIGEIGLDYYWTKNNKQKQQEVFKRQIEIAKKYKKPIVVHNRDATDDVYNILKEKNINDIGGIMHCYSSNAEMAYKFIEIGMLIGVSGIITFKNNKVDDVINKIKLEYIVLETDSPYLAPEPYRGVKNEPKNLVYIAQKVSLLKQLSYEDVEDQTMLNTIKLFDIKIKT